MGPCAQSDGHDAPRSVAEGVPGVAAVVEDVGVGFEDTAAEPVVAHELPQVLILSLSKDRPGRHLVLVSVLGRQPATVEISPFASRLDRGTLAAFRDETGVNGLA